MDNKSLAAAMQEDALEAQQFSRKYLVLELAYSPASISALEEHIDTIDFALAGGKSAENVVLLTRLWGAYLGEAIRRLAGGQWESQPDGTVALRHGDRILFPHDQIRRRVEEGCSFDLTAYLQQATT